MPGPPPKHPDHRRRRNAAPVMTQLPAEGRKGSPPKWPLSAPNVLERDAWAQLWATPQAVAWDRLGWVRSVARYTRRLVESEKRKAPTSLCSEVRQMEDRLGLSPMSMLRLRWEIVADQIAEQRETKPSTTRDRLRAVDPDAVARPAVSG
jgi:hypothetical protein